MKVINNVGLYQAVYQIISTIESTVRRIKERVLNDFARDILECPEKDNHHERGKAYVVRKGT